jgi:hypothetical protein
MKGVDIMFELKNTPDEFRAQQRTGRKANDYEEYIEVITNFVSLNKPYLMVVGDDEGIPAVQLKSRFDKAIEMLCLKDTVRTGTWTPKGDKAKLILFRKDMEP